MTCPICSMNHKLATALRKWASWLERINHNVLGKHEGIR